MFVGASIASGLLTACGNDAPDDGLSNGGTAGGSAGGGASGAGNSTGGAATAAGSSAGGSAPGGGSASGGATGGSASSTGGAAGSGGSAGAGGGGSAGSGGGSVNLCTSDILVTSSGTGHQHSLMITHAQIEAGADVSVETSRDLGHTHWVKISAADFTKLRAGIEIRKKTCDHADHGYILKCGGGASDLELPTCGGDADTCGSAMNQTCE